MPRKSSAEPTSERRVSSRIAAQPKKDDVKKQPVKKATKPADSKKSVAETAADKPESNGEVAPSAKRKVAPGGAKADVAKKNKLGETEPDSTDGEVEANAKSSTSGKKTSDGKQLKVGDGLPSDLTLNDEAGEPVNIGGLTKAVIFMYPKANTGGCTKQGQCYRDEYSSWQALGYSVFGLSNDNVTPLKNWKEKQSFPYKLISDPQRQLIRLLTGNASKTIRSHAVVDSKGKLADIKIQVSPAESSKSALEAAKKAA